MARHIPLTLRAFAAGVGFLVVGSTTLRAETVTNAPPAKPVPHTVAATARPPATNAPPALPPAMQNTLNRYGNIVAPGDVVPYPLKLRLPSPSDSEVRVPKPDDLVRRQKIEELAKLSDDDIRKQLTAWPAFSKMGLRDQAMMLQRIQDFRDYHARVAMQKAHDMGLLSTMTPDQRAKFEKEYWDKRLKLDEDLTKQFQPIYQAREQQMNDELFREFSSTIPGPLAPAPAAPQVPPQPPAKTVAKPVTVTNSSVATNAAPHVAQTPH